MRVRGKLKAVANYDVNLDIAEEEFHLLGFAQQNELIEKAVNIDELSFSKLEIDYKIDFVNAK